MEQRSSSEGRRKVPGVSPACRWMGRCDVVARSPGSGRIDADGSPDVSGKLQKKYRSDACQHQIRWSLLFRCPFESLQTHGANVGIFDLE